MPEDHFYREILGFRPYWHGGMKDDETDWVSLQVPDGTDWLEYMLNQPRASRPATDRSDESHLVRRRRHEEGAGHAGVAWLEDHGDEHAQMGRDGKWQLNVFDPDLTRIELMEFKPAEKPCCSDFTGPHPTE